MRQIQPIYEPLTEEEALSLGFPKRVLLRSGITGKVHFEDGREVLVAAVSEPESVVQEIDNEPANTISERGFIHVEPVTGDYGAKVKVYQSSSIKPSIWLDAVTDSTRSHCKAEGEATVHLPLETAKQLLNQLSWLIEKLES